MNNKIWFIADSIEKAINNGVNIDDQSMNIIASIFEIDKNDIKKLIEMYNHFKKVREHE